MIYPALTSPSTVIPRSTSIKAIVGISAGICCCICLLLLVIVGVGVGVGLGVGLSVGSISSTSNDGSLYSDEGADTGNFSVLSAPIVDCTYIGSSSCGCSAKKPSFLSPRIVQGYTAVTNSWPWMVAIFMVNGNINSFCGGFLVTYQHVVTAAHCVSDKTASMITIYAGIQKLADRNNGQSRSVSTIIVHPNYNSGTSGYDIAILTLQSAFSETSTVGKCCLTFNTSLPSAGEHAVITGWGLTSYDSPKQPNNLLQGVVQIQNASSRCISSSNITFCAVYGGTDGCFGDSGGPLMTSVNNAWTCTGVVSSGIVVNGKSCGTIGVYTRVSAFQSFISNIISG